MDFLSLGLVFFSILLSIWLLIPFIVRYRQKRDDLPWDSGKLIIRRSSPRWPHYNVRLPLEAYFDKWALLNCQEGSNGKVNTELINIFPTKMAAMEASWEMIDQRFMDMRLLLKRMTGKDSDIDSLSNPQVILEWRRELRRHSGAIMQAVDEWKDQRAADSEIEESIPLVDMTDIKEEIADEPVPQESGESSPLEDMTDDEVLSMIESTFPEEAKGGA